MQAYVGSRPQVSVDPLGLLEVYLANVWPDDRPPVNPHPWYPPDSPHPAPPTSAPYAKVCCWRYVGPINHCEIVFGQSCESAAAGSPVRGIYELIKTPTGILEYGPGGSCATASWNDIELCVASCQAANPYPVPSNPFSNCQQQASNCSKACCMTSRFKVDVIADGEQLCVLATIGPQWWFFIYRD